MPRDSRVCWKVLFSLVIAAAQAAAVVAATGGGAVAPPVVPPEPPPKVEGVRCLDHPNLTNPQRAELGKRIAVTVRNLPPEGCEKLILFLDDMPIKGSPQLSCNPQTGEVRFLLKRTDDEASDRAWKILLRPNWWPWWREISLSVGPKDNPVYPSGYSSTVRKFVLEVLPDTATWLYLGGLAVFLGGLVYLALRTSLLRTPPGRVGGHLTAYSLSRFQLTFWTFLIIAAFVFIWMLTTKLDSLNGQVLALLGIGSATALAAGFLDKTPPTGTPPAASPPVSLGFFKDLISDNDSLSINRLQYFAWTIVLGVVFVKSVLDGLEMPKFDTTLLGLMGISTGTYLGGKAVVEPKKEPG